MLCLQDVSVKGLYRPRPQGTTHTESISSHGGGGPQAVPAETVFDHSASESESETDEPMSERGVTAEREGSLVPMTGGAATPSHSAAHLPPSTLARDVLGLGMLTADAVIWMGDFNYRYVGHTFIYTHTHTGTHTHTHIHTRTQTHAHVHDTHTHTHTQLGSVARAEGSAVCLCVCVCVCVCVQYSSPV